MSNDEVVLDQLIFIDHSTSYNKTLSPIPHIRKCQNTRTQCPYTLYNLLFGGYYPESGY